MACGLVLAAWGCETPPAAFDPDEDLLQVAPTRGGRASPGDTDRAPTAARRAVTSVPEGQFRCPAARPGTRAWQPFLCAVTERANCRGCGRTDCLPILLRIVDAAAEESGASEPPPGG